MARLLIVSACIAASVGLTVADLDACGDKFLRIGRGGKFSGYASPYPASILIYKPARVSSRHVDDLRKLLKNAGHRPSVADHGTDLRTISGPTFDLVIASYPDAVNLRDQARAVASRPELLPVLNKPTQKVADEAHRRFPYLLLTDKMSNLEALAEIDRLMERRRKGAETTGG